MRLLLTLQCCDLNPVLPVNYQYPLSAAIYKIIATADRDYAAFLHERGYGKGFKLFTFSQISCPFKIQKDRLLIFGEEISFQIAFHLPPAAENFVKGLFQTKEITIADKISKANFRVASVESLRDPLKEYKEAEIVRLRLAPSSPVVAGLPNERGNYDFLLPEDKAFSEVILYNWREKIRTCYDPLTAENALLMAETELFKGPPRSRLITIKAGTREQTRIRGWMNFELTVTAEKRFLEVLMNCGAGVYNSMGCGMVGKLEIKTKRND